MAVEEAVPSIDHTLSKADVINRYEQARINSLACVDAIERAMSTGRYPMSFKNRDEYIDAKYEEAMAWSLRTEMLKQHAKQRGFWPWKH